MTSTTRSITPWPDDAATVVTDAGLETWLVFHKGVELEAFAAYPLAGTEEGRALLEEYLRHYADIAAAHDAALLLEAPTWRANPDWAATLGHDRDELAEYIGRSVGLVRGVRSGWQGSQPFLVGGPVGPRGDGYRVDTSMSVDEAAEYHAFQVGCMADAGVDVVTGLTMGYVEEAAGVVLAARDQGVHAVVSYTVETDGRLPSGMPLGEAIEATDAATGGYAHHYMINCAHPTHFDTVLDGGWVRRIGGLRANASALSHAELDEMEVLDEGDPDDLAARYVALADALPGLQVVGGCCGTDHRHVAAITAAWAAARPARDAPSA